METFVELMQTSGVRCVIVGTSGVGKTTFARQLSEVIGVPQIELDEIHFKPNWEGRSAQECAERFREWTADKPSWITDGNYSMMRDAVWTHATHLIWLNYSRARVFRQVLTRTMKRGLFRTELWAGNRESLGKAFFSRDSILLWSWTTFHKNRESYRAIFDGQEYAHLKRVEFTHPSGAENWLAAIEDS